MGNIASAKDYIQNSIVKIEYREIFNFDEFGNYYKDKSTRTLAFNDDDGNFTDYYGFFISPLILCGYKIQTMIFPLCLITDFIL